MGGAGLVPNVLTWNRGARGDRDGGRKKVVARLERIIAQSPGTAAAQSAAMRLVEARFTGLPESEEILEEKVRMLRKFRADYPDSSQLNEALRREGEILADRLEDQERDVLP